MDGRGIVLTVSTLGIPEDFTRSIVVLIGILVGLKSNLFSRRLNCARKSTQQAHIVTLDCFKHSEGELPNDDSRSIAVTQT